MCTDPYTGGSIASAEGLVQVKEIVISGLCESFVRNGMGEDAAFGDRPIALSYAPNLPLLESDPRWHGYLIWRFMIDKNHQKKGYGTRAMELALEFIRTFPCGKAEYCWLSYNPENEVARRLYRSFGFEEMEMPEGWDEVPAVLKL